MACFYYEMNGCGRCSKFVKTIQVEYESDVVILTIPAMKLKNHDKICLCITEKLPEEITPDTQTIIYVGDSSVKFTPITKLGNYVYADALRPRKIYPFYVATDTETLVLQEINKLCPTEHQFPIIPETKPK